MPNSPAFRFVPLGSGGASVSAGATAIIPTVSTGNVPQLAVDALIATLRLPKLGTIFTPLVLPYVSTDAFDEHGKCPTTAFEVFGDESWLAIQLRSAITGGCSALFAEAMSAWLAKQRIKKVLIISSVDSLLREDDMLSSAMAIRTLHGSVEGIKEYSQPMPEGYGTGNLSTLKSCIPTATIVLAFVSEGENRADAVELCRVLLKGFSLNIAQINVPYTWHGILGKKLDPADQSTLFM